MFVPVVDRDQKPLMPTTPARARKWIKSGKATPFFKKGVFCVRLNAEPSDDKTQAIAVGIDPGSKREGFTVKSDCHTFLNIQATAVDWVSRAVEARRNARRGRRSRKCPYRANRKNRKRDSLPPGTKARWQWKLRILNWLGKILPINCVVVEDIKAKSFGGKWGKHFSPLQQGKNWLYSEIEKDFRLETLQGHETKELRDRHGLSKTRAKLAEKFEAHCVDSWVLANWYTGGHLRPDNKDLLVIEPIRLHRRQLHKFQHSRGGVRSNYGSTQSLGFKRGSLAKHPEFGLTYIGGTRKGRISLHSIETGKRLTQGAKPEDIRQIANNIWRRHSSPA